MASTGGVRDYFSFTPPAQWTHESATRAREMHARMKTMGFLLSSAAVVTGSLLLHKIEHVAWVVLSTRGGRFITSCDTELVYGCTSCVALLVGIRQPTLPSSVLSVATGIACLTYIPIAKYGLSFLSIMSGTSLVVTISSIALLILGTVMVHISHNYIKGLTNKEETTLALPVIMHEIAAADPKPIKYHLEIEGRQLKIISRVTSNEQRLELLKHAFKQGKILRFSFQANGVLRGQKTSFFEGCINNDVTKERKSEKFITVLNLACEYLIYCKQGTIGEDAIKLINEQLAALMPYWGPHQFKPNIQMNADTKLRITCYRGEIGDAEEAIAKLEAAGYAVSFTHSTEDCWQKA